MNQQQIRDFFALNHTRPKKQLGQNFLVNPEVLKIILEAGELSDADTVIEIGAGLGCLTDVVERHAKHVIAIEVDELLYNVLASQFSTNPRVQLLNTDILKLELNSLLSDGTGTVPTTFCLKLCLLLLKLSRTCLTVLQHPFCGNSSHITNRFIVAC